MKHISLIVFVGFVSIVAVSFADASRMECFFKREAGIDGAVQQLVDSCPPILFNPDQEYCCYNMKGESYCCNMQDFALNMALWLIPCLIVLLIISSIVSCICCLCCPCCFVYKRRHGRVYRREPSPIIQPSSSSAYYQPIQQPTVTQQPQIHLPPGAYPVFPPHSGLNNQNNYNRPKINESSNRSSVYSHHPQYIT